MRLAAAKEAADLTSKVWGEEQKAEVVRIACSREEADTDSVIAIVGLASLFDFMRVSSLIDRVEDGIRGRLLVRLGAGKEAFAELAEEMAELSGLAQRRGPARRIAVAKPLKTGAPISIQCLQRALRVRHRPEANDRRDLPAGVR